MKGHLIASRYASGLGATISGPVELDEALEALKRVLKLFESSPELRHVLQNPGIDLEIRTAVLVDVLRAEEIPTPVIQLTRLLLERGRIALLPEVVCAFAELADERLNRVAATVTTAATLTTDQERRLHDALSRYSGKELRLEFEVDPNLIGGVVARLGGEVIDGSLFAKLERLKEELIAQEM